MRSIVFVHFTHLQSLSVIVGPLIPVPLQMYCIAHYHDNSTPRFTHILLCACCCSSPSRSPPPQTTIITRRNQSTGTSTRNRSPRHSPNISTLVCQRRHALASSDIPDFYCLVARPIRLMGLNILNVRIESKFNAPASSKTAIWRYTCRKHPRRMPCQGCHNASARICR